MPANSAERTVFKSKYPFYYDYFSITVTTSVSLEQGGPGVDQNLGCHKFYMKFEIRIIVGLDGLLTSVNFLCFV